MEDSFDKTYFMSHNLGNVVFELVSRKAFLLFFEDFNCIFGPRKHLKDTGVEALKRSALSAGRLYRRVMAVATQSDRNYTQYIVF